MPLLRTAIHPPVVRCFTPSLVLARFHEARSAMHETTAMIRRLSVDYTKYTKCQACRRRRCITPHLHGPSQPAQTAVRHVSYVMVHQWTSSPNRFYNVLPFYLRWALTSPYFILLLSLPRWLSLVDSGCMKLSMVAMVACLSFFRLSPLVLAFAACMCRYVVLVLSRAVLGFCWCFLKLAWFTYEAHEPCH